MTATNEDRDNRSTPRLVRRLPWRASIVAALVVSCCAAVPPAVLVAAHLTLAATAGLGVGVLIGLTACVLCCSQSDDPSQGRGRTASRRSPGGKGGGVPVGHDRERGAQPPERGLAERGPSRFARIAQR